MADGDGGEVHSGSGSIDHTHSVVASGVHAEAAAGVGTIAHSHATVASGVAYWEGWDKSGTATIAAGATGTVATGTRQAEGLATIAQTSATTASGAMGAEGAGTINQSSAAVASGVGLEEYAGSATIDQTQGVVATGVPVEPHSGSATIAHSTGTTASGIRGGEAQADISAVSGTTASGYRGGVGSASIDQVHDVVAIGSPQLTGSAVISHSHAVVATGAKDTGEHNSGSGVIDAGTTSTAATGQRGGQGNGVINTHAPWISTDVAAEGWRSSRFGDATIGGMTSRVITVSAAGYRGSREGQATIDHDHALVAAGTAGKTGTATIEVVQNFGMRGVPYTITGRTGEHGPLSYDVAVKTRWWPPRGWPPGNRRRF